MPVNKVAKILQVYPVRLWNVFDYWISIAHKEDVIDSLTKIGFDETSVKKGHNYITPRSRANPFAWHLINKKAFTIFDKKKK